MVPLASIPTLLDEVLLPPPDIAGARGGRLTIPHQGRDEMPLDNAPLVCDWERIGKCLCSSMMAGPSLVQCRADGGCCRFLHHMCQTEWESEDSMREAHGNRNLCAFHHPALAGLHTTLGVEVNAAESKEDINDCETEWLCDTNKSVRQVYQQTVTPTTDGNHTLPSTTVVGDLVFDLALLMTMGTGALDDNQMQTERINEFIEKGWLKKRSVNASKEMFKKEILRRHDILCMWSFMQGETDTDSLTTMSTDRSSKKPSTRGNITQLKKSLDEIEGKCPLKFISEKAWLEREIGRVLNCIEAFMDETRKEKEQNGDHLRKNHKLLMRLTHGKPDLI